MERLEKILARSGLISRRKAKGLIASGRVTVNGRPITNPGSRIDSDAAIAIDGHQIESPEKTVALLMNKPVGVLCTVDDPQRRRTVLEIAPDIQERIYPVGRLDRESGGALILTNDGELFQALTLPENRCEKTYRVTVQGEPNAKEIQRLRDGVILDGRRTRQAEIEQIDTGSVSRFCVVLTEGRKNQIRRMFDKIGYPVVELTRTHIAFLSMEGLAPGEYRHLSREEVAQLKARRHLRSRHQTTRSTPREKENAR